jgi:TonB family protein
LIAAQFKWFDVGRSYVGLAVAQQATPYLRPAIVFVASLVALLLTVFAFLLYQRLAAAYEELEEPDRDFLRYGEFWQESDQVWNQPQFYISALVQAVLFIGGVYILPWLTDTFSTKPIVDASGKIIYQDHATWETVVLALGGLVFLFFAISVWRRWNQANQEAVGEEEDWEFLSPRFAVPEAFPPFQEVIRLSLLVAGLQICFADLIGEGFKAAPEAVVTVLGIVMLAGTLVALIWRRDGGIEPYGGPQLVLEVPYGAKPHYSGILLAAVLTLILSFASWLVPTIQPQSHPDTLTTLIAPPPLGTAGNKLPGAPGGRPAGGRSGQRRASGTSRHPALVMPPAAEPEKHAAVLPAGNKAPDNLVPANPPPSNQQVVKLPVNPGALNPPPGPNRQVATVASAGPPPVFKGPSRGTDSPTQSGDNGSGKGTGGSYGPNRGDGNTGTGSGTSIGPGPGDRGGVPGSKGPNRFIAPTPTENPAPGPPGPGPNRQLSPGSSPVTGLSVTSQAPGQEQVVILEPKPKPVYTDDARKRGIEGEVKLEVVFTPSGEIRVLRILKPLDPGLDDNAVQAVRRLRFRPPSKEVNAVLSVTFEIGRSQ